MTREIHTAHEYAGEPLGPTVIHGKIIVPPLPERRVERGRLNRLLARLLDRHSVVVVSATAGSGKTTAVAEAVSGQHRAVCWLTVDSTDTAAGRLVIYLEAALARHNAGVEGMAARALAAGVPHAEVAGLLAEAAGDEPVLFVLDELERLGESAEAWSVIQSLVRHAPPSMRIVLLSRREIPAELCALPADAVLSTVGEDDLAFTTDEAADALTALGRTELDKAEVVRLTGGWVTGILFEAWRSADHVAGAGGEADPLHGYLSSHILGQLAPDAVDFLVRTSLLDEVSSDRAAALGIPRAGELMVQLRTAHLPVSWRSGGRKLRCHPRFREYLLERLERLDPAELRRLRYAHGRLLVGEGHDEEATEEFLRVDALDEARATAERAVLGVLERCDFKIAARWLGDLDTLDGSPLSTAELMLTIARDDYRRAVQVADELDRRGHRQRLAAASPRAAALLAWSYLHVGRHADARAVLDVAASGPGVAAARAGSRLAQGSGGERFVLELSGGPLDALALRIGYLYGRLSPLARTSSSAWQDAVIDPWRIGALRAGGQTQRALEFYRRAVEAGSTSVALHAYIGPEVLIDAGEAKEARSTIDRGRSLARASGSIGFELFNVLADVKLALRLEHDPAAARAKLDRVIPEPAGRFHFVKEALDTWYGMALLLQGQDAEALPRLRSAVASMTFGDRILELPTAAVFLAEAEWRAGNEDEADRAADLALDAARRQGSNHVLLQALADFPEVAARRRDAEAGADSPWHRLGRAFALQAGPDAAAGSTVVLRDFGRPCLTIDGQEVRLRIAKSYELLAYLVGADGHRARREELLAALFPGRTEATARAYLRQAIHQARHTLPEDAGLMVTREWVRLAEPVRIGTDSGQFDIRLAEAARLHGHARLRATIDALSLLERGPYLEGVESAWTASRREHLAGIAAEAQHDAAELSFALGDLLTARRLADAALESDNFREATWRLRMRIANMLGDDDGVLLAYRDCERALHELGATPSPTTRRLLAQLRR